MSQNKNRWDYAERHRKCFKCGSSPAENEDIKLFRFPNPGKTNILRCEMWAKFCFPEGQWTSQEFQRKLHNEHRMLCNKHFKKTSFIDYPSSSKKLHRFAFPCDEIDKQEAEQCRSRAVCAMEPIAGPSANVTNVSIEPQAMNRKAENTSKQSSSSVGVKGISLEPKAKKIRVEGAAKNIVAEPPHAGPLTLTDITNLISLEPQAKKRKVEFPEEILKPTIATKTDTTGKSSIGSKDKKEMKESKTSECDMNENKQYARCLILMKKICILRKKIYRLKNKKLIKELSENDCIKKISKKLTPSFARLLQGQIKNFRKKATGRRWSTDEKIVALRLFKRSPTCYRLLRRLFCLPAPTTLKIILRKFPMRVGVNQEVLTVLKKFVKKQIPSDNEFILSFDEMSIRKNLQYNQHYDNIEGFQDHGFQGRSSNVASHALVFMVAGIRKRVKQPVAYYLSSSYVTADRLAVLIKEVIRQCLSIGLNVSATVCDMDGVNRRALSILGATMESPTISVDNKEIVTLYDTPHLLKCFRNLFLKYNLKCQTNISGDNLQTGIAKWEHIRAFYEMDNANPNFVFAPCLKEDHLNPNNKQKMKVKLAAQVLSHSVAAGMYAKISQGELTSEAVVTANVISNMDKLFDALNSDSSDLRRGKPLATNLKTSTSHLKFFKEMKTFFRNIEFVGARSPPPSKEGWIWTLNAVENLWNNLRRNHNIQSLATRRLQQDPLENLFGCIRSNCGANCNPTVGQFIAGLKTSILGNLSHIGTGSNCEVDANEVILDNYKTLLTSSTIQNISNQYPNQNNINFDRDELEKLVSSEISDGEIQACAYVAGFIYKDLKVECSTCKNNLLSEEQLLVHGFVENREYADNKKSLFYVSEEFILCVDQCATICNNYYKKNAYVDHIKNNLTEIILKTVNFEFLKQCDVHFTRNMMRIANNVFFITIKRFCILTNRQFANEASHTSLCKKIKILAHK